MCGSAYPCKADITDEHHQEPPQSSEGECDHRRGTVRSRSSAITICHCCRDFLCSICGVKIEWYEGLSITNPVVQWRYCAESACIKAEATYHALPVDEMIQHRSELRDKRVLVHLQDRGIKSRPQLDPLQHRSLPSGAELITIAPRPFVLDPGEACWCNLGKDCDGDHEIGPVEIVNVCGNCGQKFQISDADPHWSTGQGPICPR